MANLISCPTCDNPCSENADTCPKCGEKLGAKAIATAKRIQALKEKKQRNKKTFASLMWACVIIFFLFVFFGNNKQDPVPPESEAQKEARIAAKKAKDADEAEKKRKGFHCLSAWDGSHRAVKAYVENNLRDPDSFEHIETRISPVRNGEHKLFMKYRAKNGFGGMTVGQAIATIQNSDCSAQIIAVE